MSYATPSSNETKSSGHHVARDVARASDTTDRAGEGRGRLYDPPIDCRVCWLFFAIFRARMEKICRIAPLGRIVLIRADTASPTTWCAGLRHRIGWDDMAGSRQDKRQIDCRVGWLFPLILREDGKNLSYSPHRSNRTDSSGHRVAHNAVRGFEALGWAGEGHGWRDKPPI